MHSCMRFTHSSSRSQSLEFVSLKLCVLSGSEGTTKKRLSSGVGKLSEGLGQALQIGPGLLLIALRFRFGKEQGRGGNTASRPAFLNPSFCRFFLAAFFLPVPAHRPFPFPLCSFTFPFPFSICGSFYHGGTIVWCHPTLHHILRFH